MNRLGLAPAEFYQLTPAEFHYALEDHDSTHYQPSKNVCETLRIVATVIHNSAFGRKKKDQIRNPKKLFPFSWEKAQSEYQTVDEMKQMVKAIGFMYGPGPDKDNAGQSQKRKQSRLKQDGRRKGSR